MKAPFYGWAVACCAFAVLFLTYGAQYSFGVFVPAMLDDLGWRRASLGGAFSLYTVVYTSLSLLSGKLTDSWGPRRVIGIGGVLLGAGILATSQMSAQWELYLWYGIIAALGMSTAYIPCNMTVVRWFHAQRGLALGLASCGASCGILAVPLIAAAVIAQWGWRVGFGALGASVLVLITLAARFMVRSPEQMGLLPDGATAGAGVSPDRGPHTGPDAAGTVDWTLREARTTLSFWLLLAAFAVAMLTITVPFVHLATFARDIGLSGTQGAMAVSVIGLFALAGSVSLGALSDRIGRKGALALALGSQISAYLLFLNARDPAALYGGAAAFGFFYGGIASLFPALVGDLFGRAQAGTIGGFIFGGAGVLGGWGPAIAGHLRDVRGDYALAFTLSAAAAAVSLILFMLLARPRHR